MISVSIMVPTCGDLRFLEILYQSLKKNTWAKWCNVRSRLRLMHDAPVTLCGMPALQEWAGAREVEVIHDFSSKGLNALWNRCVAESSKDDIAVVLNDDIWLPWGWLDAIVQVLTRNPQIALCGIPANGAKHDEIHAKERWFSDPALFDDPHIFELDPPVKYEPWSAGPCWATKPKLWHEMGGIPEELFWGYGEAVPARRFFEMGYFTASIYRPLIFHYGGNDPALHHTRAKRNARAARDGEVFAKMYGTGHLHELYPEWMKDVESRNPSPILYDPPALP